jgi:hypothetical protein
MNELSNFLKFKYRFSVRTLSHFEKGGQVKKANDKNVIKYRLGFNVPKERVRRI